MNCKDFSNRTNINKQWSAENPSPIELLNNLEFYGQRPWRQGQQGMEILDQQKERDGILLKYKRENNVDIYAIDKEELFNLYPETISIKEDESFIKVYTSGRLVAAFTQDEAKVIYDYLQIKYGKS